MSVKKFVLEFNYDESNPYIPNAFGLTMKDYIETSIRIVKADSNNIATRLLDELENNENFGGFIMALAATTMTEEIIKGAKNAG